jgi:thiamine biosynthesis lipoprotein
MTTTIAPQRSVEFACFGSRAAVSVTAEPNAEQALDDVRRTLLAWHGRLTRFERASELSRMNANPAGRIRVSSVMSRFVAAAIDAAALTSGLVDPTLVDDIAAAGYDGDLGAGVPLEVALALAPPRRPALPNPKAAWRQIDVDRLSLTVTRPAGVRLDSGGIAKGLFADMTGERLAGSEAFVVDCAGDIRIGGHAGLPRPVHVADPFGREPLHVFEVTDAGVATSGIGRRSWLDARGQVAHHLLDPSSGRPAFTGLVQATALAPTATRAEALAKAALLSGPEKASVWLPHGGVLVFDDGTSEVLEPRDIEAR